MQTTPPQSLYPKGNIFLFITAIKQQQRNPYHLQCMLFFGDQWLSINLMVISCGCEKSDTPSPSPLAPPPPPTPDALVPLSPFVVSNSIRRGERAKNWSPLPPYFHPHPSSPLPRVRQFSFVCSRMFVIPWMVFECSKGIFKKLYANYSLIRSQGFITRLIIARTLLGYSADGHRNWLADEKVDISLHVGSYQGKFRGALRTLTRLESHSDATILRNNCETN